MTPLRGTFLLASLATVGAVLGGLAGATIGFIAPGYYQAIFEERLNPVVDPIQMGVGLGAGLVLDSSLVFYSSRFWRGNRFAVRAPTFLRVRRTIVPGYWSQRSDSPLVLPCSLLASSRLLPEPSLGRLTFTTVARPTKHEPLQSDSMRELMPGVLKEPSTAERASGTRCFPGE